MNNIPQIKLGLVAVSRDCFPLELSRTRKQKVLAECQKRNLPIQDIESIVENENDVLKVLSLIQEKKINALVLYLGNFGPEGPTTLLAQKFNGPVLLVGAAEETGNDLIHGRGDAYCGMLSASYNTGLRRLSLCIPENPIGYPHEIAEHIQEFIPVAKILVGLQHLKIFSFGPRPQDFYTCHAPIQPLFDLGIEIMENSELDLYDVFLSAKGHAQIPKISEEMAKELGEGNQYPNLLEKLAQFEIGLLNFMENHLGASQFAIFANKCWPAFEKYFGFVPCYVNSRLAARGIPVACESDIYGALSEYILTCASDSPATLLDINNTVPMDMIEEAKDQLKNYAPSDLFMGFHCGNTASSCLLHAQMRYQLIMHRLMEPQKEPNITRGTLEGQIKPGPVTIFRLQATPDTWLRAYIAQGEVLNINPKSFGGIGVFAIPEMARFYRHVLIEKRFPHHTAVGFAHVGRAVFTATRMLGIDDIGVNQPKHMLYPSENPFASIQ